MKLAGFELPSPVVLAPMAGVTDRPFRILCRALGAGLAASEMLTSDTRLWHSDKSRRRMDHQGEPEPRVVQIAGSEPARMAEAAAMNAALGAQIIDINLGCPAKKVCNRAAGSALMREPELVRSILEAVVASAGVPVTLKMRTGWDHGQRNAVDIARMAEDVGVVGLAVHGRTREDMYQGSAEYDTIAEVVSAVSVPVFANGDVTDGDRARQVLAHTGAAGIMIGRGACGRPWIFAEINAALGLADAPAIPDRRKLRDIILGHLDALHAVHGPSQGVRIARKHLTWYARQLGLGDRLPRALSSTEDVTEQVALARDLFAPPGERQERAA
ncbi:MAG: tRNA dihydrouridine synthase DusB [Steroidobacteraceae bacterium]